MSLFKIVRTCTYVEDFGLASHGKQDAKAALASDHWLAFDSRRIGNVRTLNVQRRFAQSPQWYYF